MLKKNVIYFIISYEFQINFCINISLILLFIVDIILLLNYFFIILITNFILIFR
jgi:hypothetical protein